MAEVLNNVCEVGIPTSYEENKQRLNILRNFIEENYYDRESRKHREFNVTLTKVKETNSNELPLNAENSREVKLRLFVSDSGNICFFRPKSCKRGYPVEDYSCYNSEIITKISFSEKQIDKDIKFQKNCDKILKHLAVNNLWDDIKINIEFVKLFDLDKCRDYSNKSWGFYRKSKGKNETLDDFINEINEIKNDFSFIKETVYRSGNLELIAYFEKVKTKCTIDMELLNKLSVDEDYIGKLIGDNLESCYLPFRILEQIENPKIKKMCFHKNKYCSNITETKLQEIKEHIRNKEEYRTSGRNGYDVSFSYNPETNKAWYSEEYRNCGNGHYYLALNETHALYWEKD